METRLWIHSLFMLFTVTAFTGVVYDSLHISTCTLLLLHSYLFYYLSVDLFHKFFVIIYFCARSLYFFIQCWCGPQNNWVWHPCYTVTILKTLAGKGLTSQVIKGLNVCLTRVNLCNVCFFSLKISLFLLPVLQGEEAEKMFPLIFKIGLWAVIGHSWSAGPHHE